MPKVIENLREKIIEEGKKILLNERYADFNIREIAKECGIGTGTVYNYFHNKEELAREIFRNDWNKTLNIVDLLKDKRGTLKEKLHQVYCSLEEFIHSYMAIFAEIAAEREDSNKNPQEYYKDVFVRMEEFLENEKMNGSVKSKVSSAKLSYFIISSMIDCIKNNYMSFDELYECMAL